jgi:hypothetical protein
MKNQYFGDVGDYGKYALLRFLAKHDIKIAVNWYLTADDGSNDGKHVTYLKDAKNRRYDPELYDVLKKMVSAGIRSVSDFQKKNVIPSAVYYDALLQIEGTTKPKRQENRRLWHENAMKICQKAELVFLDPDNGACEKEPKPSKNSIKYCYADEIADYFEAGHEVVYYCQKGRRTEEQWEKAKNLMKRRLPDACLTAVTFHRGTQRTYIFVLHKENYLRYKELLQSFLKEWDKVFTYEELLEETDAR